MAIPWTQLPLAEVGKTMPSEPQTKVLAMNAAAKDQSLFRQYVEAEEEEAMKAVSERAFEKAVRKAKTFAELRDILMDKDAEEFLGQRVNRHLVSVKKRKGSGKRGARIMPEQVEALAKDAWSKLPKSEENAISVGDLAEKTDAKVKDKWGSVKAWIEKNHPKALQMTGERALARWYKSAE